MYSSGLWRTSLFWRYHLVTNGVTNDNDDDADNDNDDDAGSKNKRGD